VATAVVQSGNYTLELDTGFQVDAFTLDNALRGQLNSPDYVLDGTTQFADITPYCRRITYRRGRRKDTDQFGPGTMSVVLDDTLAGGILSPYDTSSPYYDPANDQPGLAPLRAIRLLRETEELFVGNVVNYDYQFDLGGSNLVNILAADGFYKLAQCYIDEWNVTAETSGERLETLLDLPEVSLFPGALRNVATGTVNLGHDAAFTVPQGTNALQYAQQINDTAEFGRLFMDRAGVFTFQERIGTTLSSPTVEFDDQGAHLAYNDLEIEFDASQVINRTAITSLDGDTGTDDDTASQTAYFIQTRAITSSLLHDQNELDAAAAYLLVPEPSPRFTSVATNFALLTSLQRDAVATVDIGDTITIEKNVIGFGPLAEELAVEGVDAVIDFATGHTVRFFTSPTVIVFQFILDDPVYGTLADALGASSNVLG
jgi:hypothetical protein